MRRSNTVLLIIALAAIPAAAYFIFTNAQRGTIACTQEALLCPDGSYVGRSGPSCTFAECPVVEHRPDWQSSSTAELSFEYPAHVGSQGYLSVADWPPAVGLSSGTLSCVASTEPGGERAMRSIDGRDFCVESRDDAAAGSRYTSYVYSHARDAAVISIAFRVRRVQCMNYDEPRRSECIAAQSAFDADALAADLSKTIRFLQQPPVVPSI